MVQSSVLHFKGLGEISPDEFKNYIGPDIRLEPVKCWQDTSISQLLEYYMGENTPERQVFIVDNLLVEEIPKFSLIFLCQMHQ